jgi:hypothetical protein
MHLQVFTWTMYLHEYASMRSLYTYYVIIAKKQESKTGNYQELCSSAYLKNWFITLHISCLYYWLVIKIVEYIVWALRLY